MKISRGEDKTSELTMSVGVGRLLACMPAPGLRVLRTQRVVVVVAVAVSCVTFGRANEPNCDIHSHERRLRRRRRRRHHRHRLECTMNQRQSDKFKMTCN